MRHRSLLVLCFFASFSCFSCKIKTNKQEASSNKSSTDLSTNLQDQKNTALSHAVIVPKSNAQDKDFLQLTAYLLIDEIKNTENNQLQLTNPNAAMNLIRTGLMQRIIGSSTTGTFGSRSLISTVTLNKDDQQIIRVQTNFLEQNADRFIASAFSKTSATEILAETPTTSLFSSQLQSDSRTIFNRFFTDPITQKEMEILRKDVLTKTPSKVKAVVSEQGVSIPAESTTQYTRELFYDSSIDEKIAQDMYELCSDSSCDVSGILSDVFVYVTSSISGHYVNAISQSTKKLADETADAKKAEEEFNKLKDQMESHVIGMIEEEQESAFKTFLTNLKAKKDAVASGVKKASSDIPGHTVGMAVNLLANSPVFGVVTKQLVNTCLELKRTDKEAFDIFSRSFQEYLFEVLSESDLHTQSTTKVLTLESKILEVIERDAKIKTSAESSSSQKIKETLETKEQTKEQRTNSEEKAKEFPKKLKRALASGVLVATLAKLLVKGVDEAPIYSGRIDEIITDIYATGRLLTKDEQKEILTLYQSINLKNSRTQSENLDKTYARLQELDPIGPISFVTPYGKKSVELNEESAAPLKNMKEGDVLLIADSSTVASDSIAIRSMKPIFSSPPSSRLIGLEEIDSLL